MSFRQSVLSAGHHRDWFIARLTAVQGLEYSRSLVRLSLPDGMGVRTDESEGRWTCSEQSCAKVLIFVLNVVYFA